MDPASAATSKPIKTNEQMEQPLGAFFEHLPWVLIVTLAFLIVTFISGFCVICQFEYKRKKYLAWKNLPTTTSGIMV